MAIPTFLLALAAGKKHLIVIPVANGVTHATEDPQDCYAILKYDADGFEYINPNGTSSSPSTQGALWLIAGDSSEVWIERTINSGTLDQADEGAGRLQLNVDRTYGIVRTAGVGEDTADVTFNFYDAPSGGSLLATKNVIFTATVETP